MELILTKEEEKAATWAELDEESLGKLIKADLYKIKEITAEQNKIFEVVCAIALVCQAHKTNADKTTITVGNITESGVSIGNWKITIKKISN